MGQKIDLRIIKTKKSLYESLIHLLREKPFEEIKVSDICENAMINRSTFYAHYNDKYELFDNLLHDLKHSLTEQLESNTSISNSKEYYLEMLKLFLDHAEDQKEIYSSIMIHNRNSVIIDMIYDTLSLDIKKRIEQEQQKSKKIPSDIVSNFYMGAVFNLGVAWLKNSNKYSKKELISYLEQLIPDNL